MSVAPVNTSTTDGRAILAADVGGTKTVVGVLTGPPWRPHAAERLRLENGRYSTFDDLLDDALARVGRPSIDVVCVAAAGPVFDGEVKMTNLPWTLRDDRIALATGAASGWLLNDLEATALGAMIVPSDLRRTIQPGTPPARGGHVVTIAPGTGLGEAILCWDGYRHHPVASEGGHVDFAPQGERQIRLLRWLAQRHDHVSYERILSGPGLVSLYEFVRDEGVAPESDAVREAMRAAADPAAVVTRKAVAADDPLCEAALDLFVRVLGAKAGNLALEATAFGGVFVAGGIPIHLVAALTDGRFREAFLAKGRHRRLLERMPLHVVLEPDAAWLGAAAFASQLAH